MTVQRIAALLHEAAETHHTVYRITAGTDADWASWYADWLIKLSELPELLGRRPVRSHLVHALVDLERTIGAGEGWELGYASHLLDWFGPHEGPEVGIAEALDSGTASVAVAPPTTAF